MRVSMNKFYVNRFFGLKMADFKFWSHASKDNKKFGQV